MAAVAAAAAAPAQQPLLAWGSDPLLAASVPLLACTLRALQPLPDLPGSLLLRGHPLRRASALGVLVQLTVRERWARLALDDGTGCVPCVLWCQPGSTSATQRWLASNLHRVRGGPGPGVNKRLCHVLLQLARC